MNLYLKQKPISLIDRLTVYDEAGGERYIVKGTIRGGWHKGSWEFRVCDPTGVECAVVLQKEVTSPPCYTIIRGGMDVGEVIRERRAFPQTYKVRGLGWKAVQKAGEFYENDYEITDDTRTVAVVSKQWRSWGDTYEIRISPDVNELDALAVTLVIDACMETV